MSSAQLDIDPRDEFASSREAVFPPFELLPELSPAALKQQVADRVAAHRARRGQAPLGAATQAATETPRPVRGRSAHIAAAVAERYAHSQSYRSFLAAEAERAVHQADAAAQIATINAQAIAVAQQRLLADLEHWVSPPEIPGGPVAIPNVPLSPVDYDALFNRDPAPMFQQPRSYSAEPPPAAAIAVQQAPAFTVRLYEDDAHPAATCRTPSDLDTRRHDAQAAREMDDDERLALDEEIDFRHHPVFEETRPGEPIAANLIEFPRQLVAARKARPRLAEGPLRDEDSSAAPQLRIFEVEDDQISSAQPASETIAPEWSSILLAALPTADFDRSEDTGYLPLTVPQPAPVGLRVMSAVVDLCLILTVQVAFTALFVFALTHLSGQGAVLEIPRMIAITGSVCTLAVLCLLYQLLFFTLSDATPGMRYARIAFCTFTDENPTRSAMRRRILATLLAAFPLGLGLLWSLLDEDTLGWHDRISRMYQRSY